MVTAEDETYQLSVSTASTAVTTVGQITPLLKQKYNLRELDIVTFVLITSTLKSVNSSTLEPVYGGSSAPNWEIIQFKLDSTSEEPLENYGFSPLDEGDDVLSLNYIATNDAGACIVTFSRNTAGGLKVASANICNNSVASGIIAQMQEPSFVEKVLATWDVSADAILQGSLS